MLAALKSPFFHRLLAGFSFGVIGMVALHIDQVAAATLF